MKNIILAMLLSSMIVAIAKADRYDRINEALRNRIQVGLLKSYQKYCGELDDENKTFLKKETDIMNSDEESGIKDVFLAAVSDGKNIVGQIFHGDIERFCKFYKFRI